LKRCSLIIPDAGPINSLWVADQLSLLLKLDMAIILVDAVYDELTSDPENWPKDFEVKKFVEGNMPPFVIELLTLEVVGCHENFHRDFKK